MKPLIITGDCVESMRFYLEDESVHTCVTSPPYYGLRDYGHDGQIGLEKSPDEYVAALVAVFAEVQRVLRPDGTLWLNLGDSYAGYHGNKNHAEPTSATNGWMNGTNENARTSTANRGGLKQKDLIGIPWRVAFALQAAGWYLRQDIIWHKPNPMPESVVDRCTKAHEYIFLLSKSKKYYFDSEAISEPVAGSTTKRLNQNVADQEGSHRQPGRNGRAMKAKPPRFGGNKYGDSDAAETRTKSGNEYTGGERRNKRSVWTVTTKPFKEAHFATFPPDLIEPCILAGSPLGGTVLDPFGGAGTTGLVAQRNGRKSILCELNPAYVDIAEKRLA